LKENFFKIWGFENEANHNEVWLFFFLILILFLNKIIEMIKKQPNNYVLKP